MSPVGSSSSAPIDIWGPTSSRARQTTLPKPVAFALSVRQTPPLTPPTQTESPAPGVAGVPEPPDVPGIAGVVGDEAGNTTTVWMAPWTGLSGIPASWPKWMCGPWVMNCGAPNGTYVAVNVPLAPIVPLMKPGVAPDASSASLIAACSCLASSSGTLLPVVVVLSSVTPI